MATHHHLDSETDLGFQAVAGQSQEHCWGARSDWLGRVLPAIPLDTVLLSLKQPACPPIWGERGRKSVKGGGNSERKGQKKSWADGPTICPAWGSAACSGHSTAATRLWSCRVSKVPAPCRSPAVPEEFLPASQQQASSTRTKHLRFNCLTISSPLQAKRGLSYLQPRGEGKEGGRKTWATFL